MGLQILFINLTPLHVAAKNGYQRIVQLLIESGANFNAQTQMILIILIFYGETPLHFAAMNGHDNIVNDLLNAGADASITDAIFNISFSNSGILYFFFMNFH